MQIISVRFLYFLDRTTRTTFSRAYICHFKPVTLLPYVDKYCYMKKYCESMDGLIPLNRKPIKACASAHNECKVLIQYCQ